MQNTHCRNVFYYVYYVCAVLSTGEVDSARRIAERALSTITMTAERDKFNVWVALMNLEDAYGGEGAEDALMNVFNRYGRIARQSTIPFALTSPHQHVKRTADYWVVVLCDCWRNTDVLTTNTNSGS